MSHHQMFLVKRVLDAMNELGSEYVNLTDLSEAAARYLNMYENNPAVLDAKRYSEYELICFKENKKPLTLVQWIKRGRNQ